MFVFHSPTMKRFSYLQWYSPCWYKIVFFNRIKYLLSIHCKQNLNYLRSTHSFLFLKIWTVLNFLCKLTLELEHCKINSARYLSLKISAKNDVLETYRPIYHVQNVKLNRWYRSAKLRCQKNNWNCNRNGSSQSLRYFNTMHLPYLKVCFG